MMAFDWKRLPPDPKKNIATLRLIWCRWGGWLAVSPAGQSLQIGVVAGTREEATAKFAQSAKAWVDNLAKGTERHAF